MNHRGIVNCIHFGHAGTCDVSLWHPSGTPAVSGDRNRWYRCAQPPANLWEPSGFGTPGPSRPHGSRGSRPMPLTLPPDMVSRKA